MIGIRVDANDKIAMGHLMRCISIGTRLRELNQEVVFIMSEEYGSDFLIEKEFEYISLNNDYMDKHGEIECLYEVIKEKNIDKLLIDSYQVDGGYMNALKGKGVKLVYIDDMILEEYPVDMLINYTIGIENGGYDHMGYENTKLLLGADYIPLRPEFEREPIVINDRVLKVFITSGGTDEFGVVEMLTSALSLGEFKDLDKVIVVGKFYNNDEKILCLQEKYGKIELHKDVKDICSVMRECDVAISAGGTTLAELSACGIPTICYAIADNQLGGVKAYSDNNVMIYAGDIRTSIDNVRDNVCNGLFKLLNDRIIREDFARNARHYVDGKGAIRIAENIMLI